MRAHLVQLDIAWEDKPRNFQRVRELLRGTQVRPGDLVLLPEMFDTGFSLNTHVTADTDARTLGFLSALAAGLGAFVQGGRTVLMPDGMGRNLMTVVNPAGHPVAEYAKIHPFSFGREPERFVGGRDVAVYQWTTTSGALAVCPAVCYDLRFPELFRVGLLRGAEVLAVGACWPEARHAHWRALLVARAIENQAFVLGVNRAGRDPTLRYAGGSIALGPRGEVLGELGPEEGVLSVELDPDALRAWRAEFPAWRDMKLVSAPAPS